MAPRWTWSTRKPGKIPDSAFAEPSEPSQYAPRDSSASQLTSPQEENPQLIANDGRHARENRKHSNSRERKSSSRMHAKKTPEKLPAAAFAEASEPSQNAPGSNPREQMTQAQEENPQLIAKARAKL